MMRGICIRGINHRHFWQIFPPLVVNGGYGVSEEGELRVGSVGKFKFWKDFGLRFMH